MRVAAVSVDSRPGCCEENLRKIEAWCDKAARQGAQLALFPELSLTGFIPNHPAGDHAVWLREALAGARAMALPLDAAPVRELCRIAQATGLLISAGMLENAGNRLHNTQVLACAGGLLGIQRKLHIPMFEMPFYNGGDEATVVETALGRIGVNICFDALLPESARLLAVQNVELILFPFAADPAPGTAEAWAAWAGPALQARCRENGVFGLACNYAGPVEYAGASQNFPGGAMVCGPRGEMLAASCAPTGEPAMLLADLPRQMLEQARSEPEYLFRFRRPELYGPLARIC